MSEDADHEVIDSPQALFRHLYEAHHLQEARDLDPYTAPVQFWMRKHNELEREARPNAGTRADRRAGTPGDRRAPEPEDWWAPAPGERRARAGVDVEPFEDPLVEALVMALVGRGHDERRVRGFVRSYVSPDGARTGADGVRAWFVGPVLDAIADRLAAGPDTPAGPAAHPTPAGRAGPGAPTAPDARSGPGGRAPAPDDVMAIADVLQGQGQGRRGGGPSRDSRPGRAPAPDDDVMAIADVLQRRRTGQGGT